MELRLNSTLFLSFLIQVSYSMYVELGWNSIQFRLLYQTDPKISIKCRGAYRSCSHSVFSELCPNPQSSVQSNQSKKMKRKKWTEEEEQTLITKYSELQTSKTLNKLKTRQKKFQPIADHVNTLHHLQDPIAFPFTWSWRDVSIKVQNMRHQYVGVKQKIRVPDGEFNWMDGLDHWPNFLKYKEVFGDVDLDVSRRAVEEDEWEPIDGSGVLGNGLGSDCEDFDIGGMGCEILEEEKMGLRKVKRLRRNEGMGFMGTQILELREVLDRREERQREEEGRREEEEARREERDWEREEREFEWEERHRVRERREVERRREFEEERKSWLMKMEEKREEEEMAWRESMMAMQIEHEKQMMQMHVNSCQNQMQVLGALVRVMYQFFGPGNDGLGGGIGGLTPQVLQNLQHPDGLVGDEGKPHSGSHFM